MAWYGISQQKQRYQSRNISNSWQGSHLPIRSCTGNECLPCSLSTHLPNSLESWFSCVINPATKVKHKWKTNKLVMNTQEELQESQRFPQGETSTWCGTVLYWQKSWLHRVCFQSPWSIVSCALVHVAQKQMWGWARSPVDMHSRELAVLMPASSHGGKGTKPLPPSRVRDSPNPFSSYC